MKDLTNILRRIMNPYITETVSIFLPLSVKGEYIFSHWMFLPISNIISKVVEE